MSANGDKPTKGDALVRAAAIELAAGVVIFERVAQLAEDWSSPGYKPDALEREQMRQALERATAWRQQHGQLLAWANRTGRRVAARVIGVIP